MRFLIIVALFYLAGCSRDVTKDDVIRHEREVRKREAWKATCLNVGHDKDVCKVNVGKTKPYDSFCYYSFWRKAVLVNCHIYDRFEKEMEEHGI